MTEGIARAAIDDDQSRAPTPRMQDNNYDMLMSNNADRSLLLQAYMQQQMQQQQQAVQLQQHSQQQQVNITNQ